VEGKLALKHIPDELMTEELMKQISALMIQMRFKGDDEDEEKPLDEDEELFNPATAAVNEQAASREAGNRMLLELYGIIEKMNEDESKATMLDGISEITEGETLASIATAELHAEDRSEDGVFEQIIDGMAEAAAEQAEAVQNAEGAQNSGARSDQGSEGFAEARPELEEVIESFTAKEADAPKEEPKGFSETVSRVQNAGEELEMLKNAKLGKADSETTPAHSAVAADQSLVFTGTNGERIEVKPTEIIEQAQRLVERAIEETEIREQSEYSLVLNPGALGRITVRMVKAADGAVSVTIAAENARTQRVLEQHSELMQSNLRNNGIDLESWQTVNESKQDMHAQDYSGSSKNPYYRSDAENNGSDDDGDRTFAEIIASM
ncbi:MAG: flagellar hook-length control protein FliK, partial [Oscillospiraceae bacterium]|nr:flagellar hook-length control protein FliK [Oscillospiraceae bacterium]